MANRTQCRRCGTWIKLSRFGWINDDADITKPQPRHHDICTEPVPEKKRRWKNKIKHDLRTASGGTSNTGNSIG